jgi:FOG: TPR repeat, SEL1 subfamily
MSNVERAHRLLSSGRPEQAIAELEAGVAAGVSGSALELGIWFLEGRHVQRDLARSRDYFRQSADLGDRTGQAITISFLALGVGGSPDWSDALLRLRRLSATDELASEQVDLIDAMNLTDAGNPRQALPGQEISAQPEVRSFESFFTSAECSYLIGRARSLLQPSVIVDPNTGQLRPHPIRTSEGATFPWVSEDLVIHALNRRIAAASGTDVGAGEPLQVLRYSPGQQYRPHLDALPFGDNQRIYTMLVYLNDGYGGGETQFTRTGVTFAGQRGDALLFRNSTPSGEPDEMTQHAGLPVVRGEKYVASRWIRERPLPRS